MSPSTNILLSSFPGLGLPTTTSISFPPSATFTDLCDRINDILPPNFNSRVLLSTPSNEHIAPSDNLLTSLARDGSNLVSLRLSVPLCGGKGGFGSQLRAAGGRMSSRKKRTAGEQNGSSRNLDGRRLRTITEAKNLAEYLAIKPEMEAREKEERKKRWQTVIEAAEKREEELRKGARGKGLSEEWVDDKEEVAERAREAVRKAMASGDWRDTLGGPELVGGSSSSAGEASGSGDSNSGSPSEDESDLDDSEGESHTAFTAKQNAPAQRRFVGFDDDDEEYMSDSEAEEATSTDKGKAKV